MAGYIGGTAVVSANGAERKKTYTITGTTTSLTGLSYTVNQVHVFHNGVRLVDGTDFTATNGNSITLTSAAESGDEVVVLSYAGYQVSDTVSASQGGTFANSIDVTGTVTADGLTVDGAATITDTGNVIGSNAPLLIKSNNGAATTSYGWDNLTSNYDYAFKTNGSERMRIDSSGNVGIGTSSPVSPLTVKSNASALGMGILCRSNNDFGFLQFKSTDDAETIAEISVNRTGANTGALRFSTNNGGTSSERMRIDSSGNLLVGTTTNPNAAKLAIGPTASNGISIESTSTSVVMSQMLFRNPNGIVGSITTSGSSTAYNTSSDYRLKTDAQPMTGASARVQALKPVNFEWISTGERVDGFLAHEAQEVVPEAVTGTKDAMRDEEYEVTPAVYEDVVIPAVLDEEGNELEAERTEQRLVSEAVMGTRSVPEYQGIDQSKLVPLLTAALQEALTEIADLKARVTALEAV